MIYYFVSFLIKITTYCLLLELFILFGCGEFVFWQLKIFKFVCAYPLLQFKFTFQIVPLCNTCLVIIIQENMFTWLLNMVFSTSK